MSLYSEDWGFWPLQHMAKKNARMKPEIETSDFF